MIFLYIVFGATVLLTIAFLINWLAGQIQTIAETKTWGIGTYKKFKREFDKYKWNSEDGFCNWHPFIVSMWCREHGCKLHAGIVEFGGKGMILMPVSLLLACVYVFKYQRKESITQKKKYVRW
jgi:hypothetical protein